jgi:hypothetical protein
MIKKTPWVGFNTNIDDKTILRSYEFDKEMAIKYEQTNLENLVCTYNQITNYKLVKSLINRFGKEDVLPQYGFNYPLTKKASSTIVNNIYNKKTVKFTLSKKSIKKGKFTTIKLTAYKNVIVQAVKIKKKDKKFLKIKKVKNGIKVKVSKKVRNGKKFTITVTLKNGNKKNIKLTAR